MHADSLSFADLSDRDLLATAKRFAKTERQALVHLIAVLIELDARRLYLSEGCSSLFTYCTQVLHLSEHAAYGRIEAARAARRFPLILELLAEGSITLTTVTLLGRHLTDSNHRGVLELARHRSKREIECEVASLHPLPDAPTSICKQPAERMAAGTRSPLSGETPSEPLASASASVSPAPPTPEPAWSAQPPIDTGTTSTSASDAVVVPAPTRRSAIEPLAPERYRIQLTVGAQTVETLRRVQNLLRHRVPNGDPAVIVDRALALLLRHLERTKFAAVDRPRASRRQRMRSRHIPAAVRRAVWARDEGRCTFVGTEGRCTERGFLEFHHIDPYALGGEADVETIALRCRAHNIFEAEQEFGLRPRSSGRVSTRKRRRSFSEGGRSGPSSRVGADAAGERSHALARNERRD